jgi:hypothetical protein
MKKLTFAAYVVALALVATPASAEPISSLFALLTVGAGEITLFGSAFLARMGASLALSALSSALRGKPRAPGIKTEASTAGGDVPQSFILGRYATGGNFVCPPYSHPNTKKKPNRYLTYVLDVSDLPGAQFSRLMVNGEYVTDLAAHSGTHDLEGMVDDGDPHLFMTFHDGTQTVADAYMLENYATHPERPWKSDMVGLGVSYAVLTFLYNREVFNSLPGVRFECDGVPLYDPRQDATVGGSGAQRWDDPATWVFSRNPAVMIYNILRGITLPDGRRWGGSVQAADLPLDNWFAAMNECDEPVDLASGGTQARYRAGLEVSVADEPVAVIEELLKACSGDISEMGGVYKLRVGPPALPVYFFTDDDVVANRPESLAPHPGLDSVHNAIHATYPSPDALWEPRDAPPRYNAEWESEDAGRQLVAEVTLPAVSDDAQVQRLMKAWIQDERRFRRHSLTLPPDAAVLEPLDTVSWTSAREGYTSKVFEVADLTDDLQTCLQTLAMRERVSGDFDWLTEDEEEIEGVSTVVVMPEALEVEGFAVAPASIKDVAGKDRFPAVRLTWDAAAAAGARGFEYEARLVGTVDVISKGYTLDIAAGDLVVSSGILPAADIEVRAKLGVERRAVWTGWQSVTTPAVGMPAAPAIGAVSLSASAADLAVYADLTYSHADASDVAWFKVDLVAPDGGRTEWRSNQVGEIRMRLDPAKFGLYTVELRAVGHNGFASFKVETTFNFTSSVVAPPDVPDFRVRVAGEFATLSWAQAGPHVTHYVVRHLPSGVVGDWPQAMDMEPAVYGQNVIVPALAGTYMIRAVSAFGVLSASATTVTTSAAGLAVLNVVETVDEAQDFAGVRSAGLEVVSGKLELHSDVATSGEYVFAAPVDLSEVYTSRLAARVVGFGYALTNTMDVWPVLSQLGTLNGTDASSFAIGLKMRTTLGDPIAARVNAYDADLAWDWDFANGAASVLAGYYNPGVFVPNANKYFEAGTDAGATGQDLVVKGRQDFSLLPLYKVDRSRRVRVKVRVKQEAVGAGEDPRLYLFIHCADAHGKTLPTRPDWNAPTWTNFNHYGGATNADLPEGSWVEYVWEYDLANLRQDAETFRIGCLTNYGGGVTAASIQRFSHLSIEALMPDGSQPDASAWSAWSDFVVGDYQARGFDFKLDISTAGPSISARIDELQVEVDMPDRVEGGDDINCPAAGVAVTFDPPFKVKPAISVDGQSLPVGARSVRTQASNTGFHQQFLDDQGNGIACSFDWVAKGYGRAE